MVYRRRYNRRYRRYKKKAAPSTMSTVASIARTAFQGVKYLNRIVNAEYKTGFLNASNAAVTRLGNTSLNICGFSKGTDQNQRIGTSIKLLRLLMTLYIEHNTSSPNSVVRVIIFRGNNENCILPTQANIFENNGTAYSHKSDERRFQTKFLYDKTFAFSTAERTNKQLTIDLKLDGHVNYDDVQSPSTWIPINGGLYMLLIGDGYTATNNPLVTHYSRVTFTDN